MKTIVWLFEARIIDDQGKKTTVAVALDSACIQSIVQETDDCLMIYCKDGSAWRPEHYQFGDLVTAWVKSQPIAPKGV